MGAELLRLAITNLGRARARLAMTSGGVVVGTTAVILLIALTIGLQNAAEAGIGNNAALTQIDVYPMWSETGGPMPQLTNEAVASLWRIPGVRAVIATKGLQAGELIADDLRGSGSIIGIDPRLIPYLNVTAAQGEISLANGQVVVGSRVGENFFDPDVQEYAPITIDLMTTPVELRLNRFIDGSMRDIDLNISGMLAPMNGFYDYVIFMSMDEVLRWNEWITGEKPDPENFSYDQVQVFATSRETANSVTEAIRDMGYGAGGIGDYLNSLNQFFGTMRLMLGAVGGIALLVAAFGVANTMTMAILERTREIGIMKAIGATNETILTLFLLEAGLVGFTGGVIGALLSKLLQNAINTGMENLPQADGGVYFLPIDPTQIGGNLVVIPPELLAFAIALATGVGIAAGLYPAWRAANLPPVLALKQE